jgi:hypothetical protein
MNFLKINSKNRPFHVTKKYVISNFADMRNNNKSDVGKGTGGNLNQQKSQQNDDMKEDLNRLGNDWKGDPDQQAESLVGKQEYCEKEGKDSDFCKFIKNPNKKNGKNDGMSKPEDMFSS